MLDNEASAMGPDGTGSDAVVQLSCSRVPS